jgi:hypothetical protein
MKGTKKLITLMLAVAFILSISAVTVSAASTRQISIYRGSVLLWSKTKITWTYDGSKILDATCGQTCGWILPNLIEKKGVSKYTYGGTSHYRYTATYKLGAGAPSPWGYIYAYSFEQNDVGHVYKDGSSYWE